MSYRPDAITKCRFCALNLHSEEGWMACEHFADCDFTTKDMKSYRNHMSASHEQIVDCELNKKTRGELFIFIFLYYCTVQYSRHCFTNFEFPNSQYFLNLIYIEYLLLLRI